MVSSSGKMSEIAPREEADDGNDDDEADKDDEDAERDDEEEADDEDEEEDDEDEDDDSENVESCEAFSSAAATARPSEMWIITHKKAHLKHLFAVAF